MSVFGASGVDNGMRSPPPVYKEAISVTDASHRSLTSFNCTEFPPCIWPCTDKIYYLYLAGPLSLSVRHGYKCPDFSTVFVFPLSRVPGSRRACAEMNGREPPPFCGGIMCLLP